MGSPRINLAWLYAITKYGYPPRITDFFSFIDDAVRLGFKAIELEVYGEDNLRAVEEERVRLRDFIESHGLKVVNVAGIFPQLLSPIDGIRERGLELFRRSVELAVFFNADLTQTDTFTPPIEFTGPKPYSTGIVFAERYRVRIPTDFSWRVFWSLLVNAMRGCSRIALDHGLRFAIEPRVGESVANSDAMLRLIDEVNMDNFGAVLDVGHLNAAKELIPLSIEKLGDKILYVHASDNDGRDNYHWSPGRGVVDWDAVFEGLRKFNFRGYVAIDVGGQDIKERLDEEVTQARVFIEEAGSRHGLW
ncbi:sugar phosphate isomerase/epimerase family protein [Caldivirga maquilingensis]|uniref:Xylose isomerase domain protein TIM barrel n=1 Tax=Caldivirga maquilingensis (strain ATCC 700844 / DSM 13496 / JCM 10307 / IC-167) TaxID=397948 RepID=A8MCI3_CALMQ|nr:sugar phosphate isomerase/epimerase [Caldivirga maquilingensis]ABW01489.1 Xylose isomerase domain protein TIM barrel [Caldivirga maquilingensis IC-167]